MVQWFLLAALVVTTGALKLTDEQFYEMPRLFELDDYRGCLNRPGGEYCMGRFELLPGSNVNLMQRMQDYSQKLYNFNHTQLNRGYCVSSRCSHHQNASSVARFEACVQDYVRTNFGLEARLADLNYCQTKETSGNHVDNVDLIFLGIIVILLLFNLVGTAYDLFRRRAKTDTKPNNFLMSWSVMSNYSRLKAEYADGDPKLAALNPLQGVKATTLLCVMLAHTGLTHYMTYLHNPEFLERASENPLTVFLHNGSVIVQTFIMVSSFLLAYNLLVFADNNPKKQLSLAMLPGSIVHRIIRIIPVTMFVIGLFSTWWRHMGSGPMWSPIIDREVVVCRRKWWTHALFLNNFVEPDNRCLIQTWFIAVDLQLYVVGCILTLTLGRWPRAAMKIIAGLFVASVLANFLVAYNWNLKPILYLMRPENMRIQFSGDPSFKWLYAAPWGSLPASMLGLFLAFFYRHLLLIGFKPEEHKWVVYVYRVSVPAMFAWVVLGCVVEDATGRLPVALYAMLDRPVHVLLAAAMLLGLFFKIDNMFWRLMSWRGFQVMGRLSLSVLMVHWCIALSIVSARTQPTYTSVLDMEGDWLTTVLMSYVSALFLYLLVEAPVQRFLTAFKSL